MVGEMKRKSYDQASLWATVRVQRGGVTDEGSSGTLRRVAR